MIVAALRLGCVFHGSWSSAGWGANIAVALVCLGAASAARGFLWWAGQCPAPGCFFPLVSALARFKVLTVAMVRVLGLCFQCWVGRLIVAVAQVWSGAN